jgi:hypothetical protein
MNSTEFLLKVWGLQCETGDFVCLSSKGSSWKDFSFPYDGQLGPKLDQWLEVNKLKDMYFCPLPFSAAKRSKELVQRSRVLWSDIDEGNYKKSEPSILWESSPGRFQGLWILPKTVDPETAAQGSKQMAYYLGGDRGGWDLTQVLRIPGTPNNKYDDKPTVTLKHFTNNVLRKIPQSLIDRWRSTIPRKVMQIIEGPASVGKRSDMLWYLEHELCDLGIPIKDVFSILRDTEWNKYRGRDDEDERFDSEMEKIRGDRDEKKSVTRVDSVELKVVDYSQLMSSQISSPGWMVRDFWMKGSHGIIAGEPKSFKSTLGMDMLFAVASDTKFLGQYPVEYGGPILIIQNENAEWIMKDRLEKLAFSRGEVGNVKTSTGGRMRIEWARNLPMLFVNQQSFMLDDAANKAALEDLIDRERPVAIKLDPLYLMFAGDVNSAKDLGPVLQWCLYIKQTYNCAVILVHHYGKGNAEKRGGQRMLGSTTLHGWIESAWYLQTQEPQDGKAVVTIDREFRGAGIYSKLDVTMSMGEVGNTHYETSVGEHKESGEGSDGGEQEIMDVLAQSVDMMAKSAIAKKVGMSKYRVDSLVDALLKDKQLFRKGERYGIVKHEDKQGV